MTVTDQLPLQSLEFPGCELVFGLVYAVGTNYSLVRAALEDGIKKFGYKPDVLRLSDLLSNFELGIKIIDEPEDQRISSRMDAGNKARSEARRGDFLAIAAVAEISRKRDKRKP